MKSTKTVLTKIVFVLAIISLVSLVIDSIAINFFREPLFLDPEHVSSIEYFILIGGIFLISFIILSLIWLYAKAREKGKISAGVFSTLIFGVLCLVFIFFEKIMADEIGREMRFGLETESELIILQMLFILQLIYSLLILIEMTVIDDPPKNNLGTS